MLDLISFRFKHLTPNAKRFGCEIIIYKIKNPDEKITGTEIIFKA
jgi:hypothetical protein